MHELGIVEDDDQDDWDDGLEMDLPSTSRKFASSSSSGPRGRVSSVKASYRTTRPLGQESPPNDWAFSAAGRSGQRKKDYLFLQWGQKERVREKVLRQYKAFAADVEHIEVGDVED